MSSRPGIGSSLCLLNGDKANTHKHTAPEFNAPPLLGMPGNTMGSTHTAQGRDELWSEGVDLEEGGCE